MEEAKASLEERVARVEGILGQMNERLNHLEARFGSLESRIESRFDSLGSRINQLFYAVITSWVTIIAALLVAIFKGVDSRRSKVL